MSSTCDPLAGLGPRVRAVVALQQAAAACIARRPVEGYALYASGALLIMRAGLQGDEGGGLLTDMAAAGFPPPTALGAPRLTTRYLLLDALHALAAAE